MPSHLANFLLAYAMSCVLTGPRFFCSCQKQAQVEGLVQVICLPGVTLKEKEFGWQSEGGSSEEGSSSDHIPVRHPTMSHTYSSC